MTTGGSSELVRPPEGSTRATLLELLFDVVFVAALALVSMLIAERSSWRELAPVVLMLMAVWWTWSITSTTTDFYDPDQRPIQTILMVTMFGAVVMAAGLAVDARALVFAIGYVAPHLVRGVVLVAALHPHERMVEQRAARFLFWFVVSGFFWIGGALLSEGWSWALWAVAVAIDYVSAGARYPTPGLGRVPLAQYEKTTEHLAERHQQFVILALGDVVLVPTLEISRSDLTLARSAAFVMAFATMLLFWQIYVLKAGVIVRTTAPQALRGATRLAPYTHGVLLAGVVCTAAAFDLVVERPTGDTPGRWLVLIFGGSALFLVGRTLFTYKIVNEVPWHRVFWLLLLLIPLVAMPWVGSWPPVLVTALLVLVLCGVVATDTMGGRLTRPLQRGRPG